MAGTTSSTSLQDRIASGKLILTAEISPPKGSDASSVRDTAGRYAGKVHALGISDNRDGVCMSALAAASLAESEGVETILHMVTRDRNRMGLVSDYLGAQALGIGNVLCTSGTHQTLGPCRAARNVYDIDSIQMLQLFSGLSDDASAVGETSLESNGTTCLGAVAAPFADPIELQVSRLAKKVTAGAKFLITQGVVDVERFEQWWKLLAERGIHEQVAIIAGITPLTSIAAALETIKKLSSFEGLRGFAICGDGDDDAALEIIEQSGLGVD